MEVEPTKTIGIHSLSEALKNELIMERIVSEEKADLIEDILIELLEEVDIYQEDDTLYVLVNSMFQRVELLDAKDINEARREVIDLKGLGYIRTFNKKEIEEYKKSGWNIIKRR